MRLYTAVIDCADHRAQAHWWAEALGWTVVYEDENEAAVIPPHVPIEPLAERVAFDAAGTGLCFVPVPEAKRGKNRVHLDFAPHASEDREAIIAGLLERGARRVDVGQPDDATFTVLADPEGNEFCVLSARER